MMARSKTCDHQFHYICYEQWLVRQNFCPCCGCDVFNATEYTVGGRGRNCTHAHTLNRSWREMKLKVQVSTRKILNHEINFCWIDRKQLLMLKWIKQNATMFKMQEIKDAFFIKLVYHYNTLDFSSAQHSSLKRNGLSVGKFFHNGYLQRVQTLIQRCQNL